MIVYLNYFFSRLNFLLIKKLENGQVKALWIDIGMLFSSDAIGDLPT